MIFHSKVTVLIAYAHPLLAAGLAAAFRCREDFDVIVSSEPPMARGVDLIVADLDNGLKFAQAAGGCRIPVMIVSHDDGESTIREALESGVRGYLLSGSTIESIVDAARVIVSGGAAIDPFAASRMLTGMNAERMTKRELSVLGLLMRGLSDKQIANRLGITVGTTKCHVKQLRRKLKASSRTDAILIAQRRGLMPRETSHRQAGQAGPKQELLSRLPAESFRSLLTRSLAQPWLMHDNCNLTTPT